jgi:hypothetical protein
MVDRVHGGVEPVGESVLPKGGLIGDPSVLEPQRHKCSKTKVQPEEEGISFKGKASSFSFNVSLVSIFPSIIIHIESRISMSNYSLYLHIYIYI